MLKLKNSASHYTQMMLKKCQDFYGIKKVKSKILNNKKKTIAIATIAAIAAVISVTAANYRVGYTVKVENTVLGTVATKGEYYEVLDEVTTEVQNISEIEFAPITSEEFNMEIVPLDAFTEKEELAENLKAISEGMKESYVLSKNGEFVIALEDEESANELKETYLEHFKSQDESVLVSYAEEVTVELSHVPEDTICTYDEALDTMLKGKFVAYEVSEGDTLESLAENYNTLPEKILTDNKIEKITAGETIKIYTGEPLIPIKTVEYINGNVEIPFEIVQKEDASIYEGQKRIETKGVVGTKYLHAYITKVNGIISEENIIESTVIKEPVTQVELIGTKEPPKSSGTGSFIMPTSGRLTSPFGKRWGRSHQGIDVAAQTGTPIYASDNGIVVESQYRSNGYGNIIKIDHQNGFVTYYAHCSSLYANEGDIVAKGDLIATVGSTGRSTGPHLHFEIRQNDVPQNPYNYIK